MIGARKGVVNCRQHEFRPCMRLSRPTTRTARATKESVVVPATTNVARTVADLNDPAHIGASAAASVKVKDYGQNVSLHQYMTLPIEQYFVLDPKQIRFLGGNRFLLLVQRLNLFTEWIEPKVEVSVTIKSDAPDPSVMMEAENCTLRGSDLLERLRLDQRFCMRFVTQLTWSSPLWDPSAAARAQAGQPHAQSSPQSTNGTASPYSSIPGPNSSNGANGTNGTHAALIGSNGAAIGRNAAPPGGSVAGPPGLPTSQASGASSGVFVPGGVEGVGGNGQGLVLPAVPVVTAPGEIRGSAKLDVWSEVIPPFTLMPRPALEASCNVVMSGLVNSLLPLFLRRLAADYDKWANSEAYRTERALRSKPLA